MTNPLQIGVTGGIGSGKSLVCKIFRLLGIPIYDADTQAKILMATDPLLIRQIKKEFGDSSYDQKGQIDRKHIAQKVFGNEKELEKLNGLVHPRVHHDYQQWLAVNKEKPYVIKEAALIFEAGSWKGLDKMIVVTASESIRMKRVLARDSHRNQKDVENIFRSQLTEEDKVKRADFVVVNDESQLVIPQVLILHNSFVESGR